MNARRIAMAGQGLLELLIAIAIAGALVKLALPAYGNWIARLEQRAAAEALRHALDLARSEAIKRSSRVTVCQTNDGKICTGAGGWERGWLTFEDADANAEVDSPKRSLRSEPPMRPGITIEGNKPIAEYVSYTAYGQARTLNGALQMGTFTVCRPGLAAIDVVLANSGRLRLEETAKPCP
ncbi:MAG TPA: GspH/FimT family pseudopilin [Casimicrobiaceae bacterium]|jgi:type IV fimbrial biogenesis protein FimT